MKEDHLSSPCNLRNVGLPAISRQSISIPMHRHNIDRSGSRKRELTGTFGRTDIKSTTFILQRAGFRNEREERGDE